jgi:hypothetical protein
MASRLNFPEHDVVKGGLVHDRFSVSTSVETASASSAASASFTRQGRQPVRVREYMIASCGLPCRTRRLRNTPSLMAPAFTATR